MTTASFRSRADRGGAKYPYLWRFWRDLPPAGRFVIFDRTWYGRVLVERVEGFADPAEWQRAYDEINDFEAQMAERGYYVAKFWLHISQEEQLARFQAREETPTSSTRSPRRTTATARSGMTTSVWSTRWSRGPPRAGPVACDPGQQQVLCADRRPEGCDEGTSQDASGSPDAPEYKMKYGHTGRLRPPTPRSTTAL